MIRRGCSFSFKICKRRISSKVPEKATWISIDKSRLPNEPRIDKEVNLLERLSLVEFDNQEGVDRLTKAAKSANQLHAVNTNNIEPMDSVLEDKTLYLRDDSVTDGFCRDDILKNASVILEDYYVAPPGIKP
ncbi:glutamyl-tRNA(Gln) amidotransferase subunit C, mitochondrial-like isoform X2 [Ostrea edulis]|uniref:glutamyl-tRNA(Gln) amidotransferase subunit C, mitochondrial-like isoform X2 n=1 Tax=Ostrea edulis TaxID=37623 RepID=UPI002094C8A0|nr:glutamyl-tRNA(Gln) amidotransferase subunit C, mitochondrial-like isoform X2 [Ostrea edulis]